MVFCNEKVNGKVWFNCSHNPYFNRWFSAILEKQGELNDYKCHNPYFNRWFSAISEPKNLQTLICVTILILIDGFLQSGRAKNI